LKRAGNGAGAKSGRSAIRDPPFNMNPIDKFLLFVPRPGRVTTGSIVPRNTRGSSGAIMQCSLFNDSNRRAWAPW
jgi:hypothetical protein